ncbi:MAG: dihydropteroate synthase [Desulfobacteraceae bacterium]
MIPKAAFSLCWNGRRLDLGPRTLVMGVLNVTPDSFADGGRYLKEETAIEHGLSMAAEGADILDVGGESTRPFSDQVSVEKEKARVVPVIEALARKVDIPISIDTTKVEVARAAFQAGASILNDVSALRFDTALAEVAAEAGVPVVLMHMKGEPRNMQMDPTYKALLPEVLTFLEDAVQRAVEAGIAREHILIDPGIGFGKTFDHNLQLLRDLSELSKLDLPVVLGCSRKAFLGGILGKEPDGRDVGTMAAVAAGVLNGAHVVRVHNVGMAVDTVRVIDAIQRGSVPAAEGRGRGS